MENLKTGGSDTKGDAGGQSQEADHNQWRGTRKVGRIHCLDTIESRLTVGNETELRLTSRTFLANDTGIEGGQGAGRVQGGHDLQVDQGQKGQGLTADQGREGHSKSTGLSLETG